MEKLEIKNFGGMRNVTIDINKINIFIGEQATGKSLIAKVLFFCKSFFDYYKTAIMQHRSIEEFENKLIEIFESFFNVASLEANFEINYTLDSSLKLKIFRKDKKTNINYGGWKKKYNIYISGINSGPGNRNRNCDDVLKDIPVKKQIFIPAGRANIAIFQNQMWKIVKNGVKLDPFLIDWGDFYQEEIKEKIVFNENLFIENNNNITEVIKGAHKRRDGIEYLEQGERDVPLNHLSSGQQEAISILELSLLRYSENAHNDVAYIEEPEAHLHPSAQKRVTEIIAQVFNEFNGNMQIVITTHSPYILTSFNNLICAGTVKEKIGNDKQKNKDLKKIIGDEKNIINCKDVFAFNMLYKKNGYTVEKIMDKETGLINAEKIDKISDELAKTFDKLLELEDGGI